MTPKTATTRTTKTAPKPAATRTTKTAPKPAATRTTKTAPKPATKTAPKPATANTEQKKLVVRRLVGDSRGFAEQNGFQVTNNPASLFQVLYLSILLRRPGDFRQATAAAQALRGNGWESAARMARSLAETRTAVLRDAGRRADAVALSTVLGDLAQAVVDAYRGDLRRLRVAARYDPDRERELLKRLPGVDDEVVDLFLREAQALWSEAAPVADRRALVAARRLGLGRSANDLAGLVGRPEGERLAWLVGALARTDLENRYSELRELAPA